MRGMAAALLLFLLAAACGRYGPPARTAHVSAAHATGGADPNSCDEERER